LSDDEIAYFAGNQSNNLPDAELPLASVYSGHQFGVWAGQLGDGRALWLGEVAADGARYELQLKGSGRTPYSRMGDGRAVLRSSIREFLASEAMHALGIPTTLALCVIGSPLPVQRETVETAAVTTRIAETFLRFGHFEHFYALQRYDVLKALANHSIARIYPECAQQPYPYASLLEAIVKRTATLLAHWQSVGFCHGVMNTDNMSIAGLTIDYGPYGFIDGFNAHHICNHSDHSGRYAYDQQPQIAYWNLTRLAQALLPLLNQAQLAQTADEKDELDATRRQVAVEQAQSALATFETHYQQQLSARLRAKLGFANPCPEDTDLINRLFALMHTCRADFTLTFRRLGQVSRHDERGDAPLRALFTDAQAFDAWCADYRARLKQEERDDAARQAAMQAVNPKYVLRNHLAEQAIRQAQQQDFSEVERLRTILRRPFDEQPEAEAAYAGPAPEWADGIEVSCSS
jgi:uncharacterized protein YdiU (UPF0061 family)